MKKGDLGQALRQCREKVYRYLNSHEFKQYLFPEHIRQAL